MKTNQNRKMSNPWRIKTFRTKKAQEQWFENNRHRYQIVEVFVNNGFAYDYRKLKRL